MIGRLSLQFWETLRVDDVVFVYFKITSIEHTDSI